MRAGQFGMRIASPDPGNINVDLMNRFININGEPATVRNCTAYVCNGQVVLNMEVAYPPGQRAGIAGLWVPPDNVPLRGQEISGVAFDEAVNLDRRLQWHSTETGRVSSARPNVSNVPRSGGRAAPLPLGGPENLAFHMGNGQSGVICEAQPRCPAIGEDLRGVARGRVMDMSHAPNRERREMIYYIRERELLIAFYREDPDYIVVGIDPELPHGAVIRSVHHEPHRAAFAFIVYHPSFDIVPDSQSPPNAGVMPFQYRTLTRAGDGRYDIGNAPLE